MKQHLVILTGAGISAESGIKTFRDNDGLWENHTVEEVATPQAFASNPELVYRFYNVRRQQLLQKNIKPNRAHYALAKLQQAFNGKVTLITQNVDNLHEKAGSNGVIHMHGELLSAKCNITNQRKSWTNKLTSAHKCTCCETAQAMRPDIVWFGEMPMHMEHIYNALSQATQFIAIGTSGNVYPAAGFVDIAHQSGAKTLLINLESSSNPAFDEQMLGSASEQVNRWVHAVLGSNNELA